MKKILPYILILVILTGILGPVYQTQAQTVPAPSPLGTCTLSNGQAMPNKVTELDCTHLRQGLGGGWVSDPGGALGISTTPANSGTQQPTAESELEKGIDRLGCGLNPWTWVNGCMVLLLYNLLFVLPASILHLAAYLFNALLALTLSSSLYKNTFIPEAWKIIRDISNIFFILILLYIAIKMILNLGGHEVKKMIGSVIIMAFLVNFSMFFTQVVIDASNVLALIFYNKISVAGPDGNPRPYDSSFNGSVTEKDFAGAIVSGFNPAGLMTAAMFADIPADPAKCNGGRGDPYYCEPHKAGVAFYLTIIFVSCAVFLLAAYAFLVAGISFLARLIELWILIIFSPFAFMSYSLPILSHVPGVGWEEWSKRLLKIAFMAPIFMLFLYLISRIVQIPIFKDIRVTTNTSATAKILLIVIPAAIYMLLLMKATSYAKKGSGAIGEAIFKGAKMVGGLALGAATGGAALAGTGLIGGGAMRIANNDELRRKALGGEGISKWEQRRAKMQLGAANYLTKKSFDVRQTGLGKFAESKTGMKFDKGLGFVGLGTKEFKGGRKEQLERAEKEGLEKAKTYELTKDGALKQNEKHARAVQYEKDKEEARNRLGPINEEEFKRDYEKGGDMNRWGLNKTVQGGVVEEGAKNAADTNQDRRTAYANSLDKKATYEATHAVRTFFKEWAIGAAKMAPAAIGATVVAGPLAGGAVALGGGFLSAFKQIVKVQRTDEEVVATIRKGEDPLKKALETISKEVDSRKGEPGTSPSTPRSSPPAAPLAGSPPTPGPTH